MGTFINGNLLQQIILIALTTLGFCAATTTKCASRQAQFGIVCVCTASYCDYLEEPQLENTNDIVLVSTSKAGLRFDVTKAQFDSNDTVYIVPPFTGRSEPDFEEATLLVDNGKGFLQFLSSLSNFSVQSAKKGSIPLFVDREKTQQKIVGFGGAFTGAVSHLLDKLSPELRDHLYKSYYHKDGIGFNIVRTPIGGCDFDLEPWAYNEQPRDDAQLSNFTKLDPRDEVKIQQLQRLKAVANLPQLKIMASAWSPPIWMKSNENWTGFSYLKPEYYQTWADYHLRYLELMDAKNMPIWAITTGNEPLNGIIGWMVIHFMSLGWTPSNQAIWLSENLGPTIRKSKFKDVLILGNDDQRYTYPAWFRTMNLSRSNALDYLDGMAVHWYWDEVFGPELIDKAHNFMPNKIILNTESSVGDRPLQRHEPLLGSWERGTLYTRSLMQDLQHHFNGWIDWNLMLNEKGGPNYVNNHVDAAIIVNTNNNTEFYKQPMFYALGHFSKFIPEGSERIETELNSFALDVVGFKRPDNRIVIVLSNNDPAVVDVVLKDSVRGNIVINIPGNSLHTIIYN